ncbi:C1 family peptidase [Deinococcus rubellus]|uniref:C1 family peptidase n=1 Tax=Deinococcus rubellus TaxID=1889240 RepID=UPI0031EB7A2A
MTGRAYGYIEDAVDTRDYQFAAPHVIPNLPALLDMGTNANYPESYDQGFWGECVAFAVNFAMAHAVHVPHPADTFKRFSEMRTYYLARALRGLEGQDSGCQIRDAIKVAAKQGMVDEVLWDYTAEHLFTPPPPDVLAAGLTQAAIQYSRISSITVDNIRAALFSGHPVVFGTLVYPAFESDEVARTGLVPMPQDGERPVGGHAMAIIGYDHKRRLFKVRNSWNPGWGDNGHAWMPYDYVASLRYSSDFWVIQRAGQAA